MAAVTAGQAARGLKLESGGKRGGRDIQSGVEQIFILHINHFTDIRREKDGSDNESSERE